MVLTNVVFDAGFFTFALVGGIILAGRFLGGEAQSSQSLRRPLSVSKMAPQSTHLFFMGIPSFLQIPLSLNIMLSQSHEECRKQGKGVPISRLFPTYVL
jgi:hypothetical protein